LIFLADALLNVVTNSNNSIKFSFTGGHVGYLYKVGFVIYLDNINISSSNTIYDLDVTFSISKSVNFNIS